MKDNADSDAGPYHSQNKRKHIKKSQGIVTPLNRVFDYAFLREATSHKGELAPLCGDCRDPAPAGVSEATSQKGELAPHCGDCRDPAPAWVNEATRKKVLDNPSPAVLR